LSGGVVTEIILAQGLTPPTPDNLISTGYAWPSNIPMPEKKFDHRLRISDQKGSGSTFDLFCPVQAPRD
jgi:hypothetical protein